MKAAVLTEANTPLTIEDVEIEKPKRREVLLRTAFAGLCHSDLHFMEGLYPYPRARACSATKAPPWSKRSARTSPTSSPAITSSPACRCSAASARNA